MSKKRVPWTTVSHKTRGDGKFYNPSRHCSSGLPRAPLASGFYLVHNHVRPSGALGLNGFRAWVQQGRTHPELVECKCGFDGLKNASVNKHYRVRGLDQVDFERHLSADQP
jgi:hypothetical protein